MRCRDRERATNHDRHRAWAGRGRDGATLAESFRKYPKVFNDLFTNMLQVGESGGVLDVVLQRLSGYIEKAAKLKSKVKGAMVYPATIISVAVLVIVFMMIFVIPTFAKMFQGMGADLPLPTKVVMWLSDFTQKYIIVMVGVGAGAIYALKRYYNTENGSNIIDGKEFNGRNLNVNEARPREERGNRGGGRSGGGGRGGNRGGGHGGYRGESRRNELPPRW